MQGSRLNVAGNAMSRGQGIQLFAYCRSYANYRVHIPVNSCYLPASLWRWVVPHIYFQKGDRGID